MSNSSKGAELERRAIAMAEAEGFGRVHRTIRAPIVKWVGPQQCKVVGSHSNDLFNACDLVCVDRHLGFLWVQVTAVDDMGRRQKKVVQEIGAHFPAGARVEVWGWVGGAKRLDKRFPGKRVYRRRQYFRRVRYDFLAGEWQDVTPPGHGWVDGPPPAQTALHSVQDGPAA